jgi:hypothetical protein
LRPARPVVHRKQFGGASVFQMSKDTPNRLYKYFGAGRINVLQRCLLRYSPLAEFNDPFEGRPQITALSTLQSSNEALETVLPGVIRETYNNLNSNVKEKFAFEQFSALLLQYFRDQQTQIFDQLQHFTPLVTRLLDDGLALKVGACCFSEVPDSLLMWSHYADSHSGFVIEFDSAHPHFHEQRTEEDELRHLRRVEYREGRPSGPLTELSGVEIFFVKSSHWSYEREWRMLRSFSDASIIEKKSPHTIYLFSYPIECIRSVIIGARMKSDTEDELRRVLQAIGSRSPIQLQRATLDESHFGLIISDVSK